MQLDTMYIVINLVVLAVLLIGGYIVIRELQRRGVIRDTRKPKDEPINPITGEKTSVIAVVAGITKNLRNQGERETYYVICNYKDPDSRRSTTFTSRELMTYPGKDIIGKPVKVTVDPNDPENYQVDIDSILQ